MAAFVQGGISGALASSTTPAFAYSGATTAGNLLVAEVNWAAATGTITQCVDSAEATLWTAGPIVQLQSKTVAIYYLLSTAGGAAPTVTFTLGTAQAAVIAIYEFSGGLSFDTSNTNSGISASPTSGVVSTTGGSDILVAAIRGNGANSGVSAPWVGQISSSNGAASAYQLPGVNGAYQATWTTVSATFAAAIIAFKSTQNGSGTIPITDPTSPIISTSFGVSRFGLT